jgi:hypothetical protein
MKRRGMMTQSGSGGKAVSGQLIALATLPLKNVPSLIKRLSEL